MAMREVRNLLANADPDGLLSLGAPADEYEDSVARIASQLLRGESIDADRLFGPADRWRGTVEREQVVTELRTIQRRLAQ